MGWKAWLYFGFTSLLVVVLSFIMIYYFRKASKDRIESPKHRMLEED
jgi:hypothetical protein